MPGKRKANDELINANDKKEHEEIKHQTKATKKTKFNEANTEIEEQNKTPLRRSERIKAKDASQSDKKSRNLHRSNTSKEKRRDEEEPQPKKKIVRAKQEDETKTKDKKEEMEIESPKNEQNGKKKDGHNGDLEEEEDKKELKGKKIVNQGKHGAGKQDEKSKTPAEKKTKSNKKEEENEKKNEEKDSADSETLIYPNKAPLSKMVNAGSADFSDFGRNKDEFGFVDKTMFIKEVGEKFARGQTLLVTRPRRSGKSLNLSMLSWYYSILQKKEHDAIFEGTEINNYKKFKEKNANKYPVVFLDFKDFESRTFAPEGWPYNQFFKPIRRIVKHYKKEITKSTKLDEDQKKEFTQLGDALYQQSLSPLYSDMQDGLQRVLEILEQHYGEKCIVLIDEYDAPYNTIISHNTRAKQDTKTFKNAYKNFLQNALKASEKSSLHFCVMTGVLKIKHDQLLSGLNNLRYDQLLSKTPSILTNNYFGFTESEVTQFVKDVTGKSVLTKEMDEMRKFYNGYRILHFKEPYYNPWSVVRYTETQKLCPYWENTSTDVLLRNCYEKLPVLEKAEFAFLFENDLSVQKRISDTVFLEDLMKNDDLIWSVLLHTGYLTFCEGTQPVGNTEFYNLKIPNRDVKQAFKEAIKTFEFLLPSELIHNIYHCFKEDDIPKFFVKLNDWIKDDTTIYAYASGAVYHMFLYQTIRIALKFESNDYKVHSERIDKEFGNRFDIVIVCSHRIYLVEVNFLASTSRRDIQNALQKAVNQIDEKDYQKFIQGKNLPLSKIGVVGQNRTLYHHISNE